MSSNATREQMFDFVLQYAPHSGRPMVSVVHSTVFEQAPRVEQGLAFEA
ncbi:hypothetical protein [Sphingobium sp.]|nr:hypothetical protein [Sphingobium sp.]